MHLGLFVCVSVRLHNSQTILPFDLIFYTRIIMPVTRLGLLRLSESGLNHLFMDSSQLGDRPKYAIKVRHDVKPVF